MNLNTKRIILIVLAILLVVEIGAVAVMRSRADQVTLQNTEPSATDFISTEPSALPTETIAPTAPPTEPPTEPPVTEPPIKYYTLSFAGDCTLGSAKKNWLHPDHFVQTIGENYDYPFYNVREYFENDDFTIINLEGPLTDDPSGGTVKEFVFRGPTAYTQIMTGSSVEAVTLANNHAEDYGKAGYDATTKALGEAGLTYVEKNGTALYTTESGLTIGLYAGAFDIDTADMKKDIAKLRKDGAEIVICAFHWGQELAYYPNGTQVSVGRAAIDAGANIVYGHHPHVLQPIEEYKGGLILYSVGNFSFGGAAFPTDFDTALFQLEVIRDETGKVFLGDLNVIPCTIRGDDGINTFQPTPVWDDPVYSRVLRKLGDNFTGTTLNVTYSKPGVEATEPTTSATEETTGG